MLVNETIIAIVFKKVNTVLDDDGGNQAVNRISNRDALAPEFAINGRAKLEGCPVIFQINQILKTPFGGNMLRFIPNALQNFGENKAATANIVPVLNALFELSGLFGLPSVKEINPDR